MTIEADSSARDDEAAIPLSAVAINRDATERREVNAASVAENFEQGIKEDISGRLEVEMTISRDFISRSAGFERRPRRKCGQFKLILTLLQ